MRDVLEALGLPFVGSGPASCRQAFDKPVASSLVRAAGVAVPASVALPHATFRELGAAAVLDAVVARLGLPLMVKPTRGGSSLGASVVRDAADLPAAMVAAFAYGDIALIETFVTGTEVAVSVVEDESGAARAAGGRDRARRRLLRLRRALHRRCHRVLRRPRASPTTSSPRAPRSP